MKAHDLIADPAKFKQGTAARDRNGKPCGTAPDSGAVQFDCLGALLFSRAVTMKAVFDLCESRHGHRYLGKLDHKESLELLRAFDA